MPFRLSLSLLLLALSGGSSAADNVDSPWLSRLILSAVPRFEIPPEQLPDAREDAPSSALNYARSASVDLNLQQHGQWLRHGEQTSWRLKLHSDEARSLSLTLDRIQLPASAELRLYDGEGTLWHGPISAARLQRRAQYWSPVVPGDTLLVELTLPTQTRDQARLHIRELQHGDVPWFQHAKSGSCNIDVACSQADPWQDAVRATARITIANRRLCSAVLLNNTRQDGSPLLLTANHCGIGESAEMPASSVVVYWNYETSRCGGSPDGNLRHFQEGSTLLASGASADFSLVRLDQIPPASFQVYYAGWDARSINPNSGASVHHPGGDEKRISLFEQQAEPRTANVDGNRVQSWQVFWNQGVTEAGSSGAGLWNQQHRVVGQLSGGNSSCSNPEASDVFGRLDAAWQASAAPSGQLRVWLDPTGSGQTTLDGLDSQNASLRATSDAYPQVPVDSQLLRLDVLSNDAGARPLRLISASATQGDVQIEGQNLLYQFATGSSSDTLRYQVMNRWGEVDEAEVTLYKPRLAEAELPTRGGAAGWPSLLLLAALIRWRRKRAR